MSTPTVAAAGTVAPESGVLFAVRFDRLRTVSQLLAGLQRDYSNNLIAEKRAHAQNYMNGQARSHGERQAYASASVIDFTEETLAIRGQILALEEERDFIKFAIEHGEMDR